MGKLQFEQWVIDRGGGETPAEAARRLTIEHLSFAAEQSRNLSLDMGAVDAGLNTLFADVNIKFQIIPKFGGPRDMGGFYSCSLGKAPNSFRVSAHLTTDNKVILYCEKDRDWD
jgi:hypothetical protein